MSKNSKKTPEDTMSKGHRHTTAAKSDHTKCNLSEHDFKVEEGAIGEMKDNQDIIKKTKLYPEKGGDHAQKKGKKGTRKNRKGEITDKHILNLSDKDQNPPKDKKPKKRIVKKKPTGSKETVDSNSSLYSKIVHMTHAKGHKDKGQCSPIHKDEEAFDEVNLKFAKVQKSKKEEKKKEEKKKNEVTSGLKGFDIMKLRKQLEKSKDLTSLPPQILEMAFRGQQMPHQYQRLPSMEKSKDQIHDLSGSLEVGGDAMKNPTPGDKNVFATKIASQVPDASGGITRGPLAGGRESNSIHSPPLQVAPPGVTPGEQYKALKQQQDNLIEMEERKSEASDRTESDQNNNWFYRIFKPKRTASDQHLQAKGAITINSKERLPVTFNSVCQFCRTGRHFCQISSKAISICSFEMLYFKGCGKHFCVDHGMPHERAYLQIEKQWDSAPSPTPSVGDEGLIEWSSILPHEDNYAAKKSYNRSILKEELSDELFALIAGLDHDQIRFCHDCQFQFMAAVEKQQKRILMIKMFSVLILIIILLFVLLVSFSKDTPVPPCSIADHYFYPNGLPCPMKKDEFTLAKPCLNVEELPLNSRHQMSCMCPDYFKYDPSIDHYCVQPKCKKGEALSVFGTCEEIPYYNTTQEKLDLPCPVFSQLNTTTVQFKMDNSMESTILELTEDESAYTINQCVLPSCSGYEHILEDGTCGRCPDYTTQELIPGTNFFKHCIKQHWNLATCNPQTNFIDLDGTCKECPEGSGVASDDNDQRHCDGDVPHLYNGTECFLVHLVYHEVLGCKVKCEFQGKELTFGPCAPKMECGFLSIPDDDGLCQMCEDGEMPFEQGEEVSCKSIL